MAGSKKITIELTDANADDLIYNLEYRREQLESKSRNSIYDKEDREGYRNMMQKVASLLFNIRGQMQEQKQQRSKK